MRRRRRRRRKKKKKKFELEKKFNELNKFTRTLIRKYNILKKKSDLNENEDNVEIGGKMEEVDDEIDVDQLASERDTAAIQKIAQEKQKKRQGEMATLLRMMGFTWMADSHDLLSVVSSAGNVLRLERKGL